MSDYRHKKRFGQNFLRDQNIVRKIVTAALLTTADRALEIGPGLGALTDELLHAAGQVEVMEVDRDLLARLKERHDPRLLVHEGDALLLQWDQLLRNPPYVLVANLPYNISTPILFKIIEHRDVFKRLVLMFQKEVGDRIRASPGTKNYGVLSIFSQLHFSIEQVCSVAPTAFIPSPKVHSVVLAFTPLAKPRAHLTNAGLFRKVVRAAFNQRRKTLRNALRLLDIDAALLDSALMEVAIDPQRRGETLTLEEFAALSNAIAVQ
ncbi:MAG: 16S rRNA (adenine(1518)-N(6)/adenine(1519)-N(6))-dimethyltransferase RsmA [Desulfuromonadaceae bacterium]|nr:16S rRNA (adenine(1518)-N(6)/adenine(1519)-N(6))-dimethyltransferase RsmA [Desulfuromonadaceae bacterium]